MTSPQDPALDALTDGLAEELVEVSTSVAGDVTSYARGGIAFARVSASVLEVRLPDDIADAALRTLDTSRLPGKGGWIRFVPATDDRHVVDRAAAWFVTGWRHALEGST